MTSRQASVEVSQKRVGSVRKLSLTSFMPRPAVRQTRRGSSTKRVWRTDYVVRTIKFVGYRSVPIGTT